MKGNNSRLTEEQEELRLDGLRILARLIVRAYFASQMDGVAQAGVDRAPSDVAPARKLLGRDDGHVQ